MTRVLIMLTAILLVVISACGGDDASSSPETAANPSDATPVANACPPEGCEIRFVDVAPAGEELQITWEANFLPDFSKNHIHLYWDNFEAAQVSSDAESNGLVQGDWVPTDAYPSFTTEGVVSLVNRGDSTRLCVTAADKDHAVLDSEAVDCFDVGGLV